MKVILLRGLAASGKSTLMNSIKNKYPKWMTWSKDTIFDELLVEGIRWDMANKQTYTNLFNLIDSNKDTKNILIIDAPYYKQNNYQKLRDFCLDRGIIFTSVLITCSNESQWRARFKERSANPKPNQTITDYGEIKKYYGSMNVQPMLGELVYDSYNISTQQYKNLISYIHS